MSFSLLSQKVRTIKQSFLLSEYTKQNKIVKNVSSGSSKETTPSRTSDHQKKGLFSPKEIVETASAVFLTPSISGASETYQKTVAFIYLTEVFQSKVIPPALIDEISSLIEDNADVLSSFATKTLEECSVYRPSSFTEKVISNDQNINKLIDITFDKIQSSDTIPSIHN
jgi:hypothetical protein